MNSAAVNVNAHGYWSAVILVAGADDINREAIFTVDEFLLVVLYNSRPMLV